jgi:zinc transport system substrate-binding protein
MAAGLLALGGLAGVAACSGDGAAGEGKINVVTGFYPLQFVAERVGGDAVSVTNLAKPGAEPHDLELKPQQVAQVADAHVVVYLKGFQPAVDKTVAQEAKDTAFDAAAVEPLLDGGKDPHLWLDPTRLAAVADRLADRLGQADPDRAADYRSRAAALRGGLEELDREYAEGLKTCQRREIVVSHMAFGYLANRYHLEQVGINGLTPEAEPSPQRLADIAEKAREHRATTIFFETLVSPKVAEAIAREVGAKTAVLDPIEGLAAGSTEDYLSVMRANLATLKPALGCS